MIGVIDYGAGNIGSILNMIKKAGGKARLVRTPEEIADTEKLILPGVGHFDHGMNALHASGLTDALHQSVLSDRKPILGICLGAQLMTRRSEEGTSDGLAWIDAEVRKFRPESSTRRLRVPHMGWNHVRPVKESRLVFRLPEPSRFYFVHSYYIDCNEPADILFTTSYGHDFTSGFERENIFAVQFHPEKSHKYGYQLLQNFIKMENTWS